jgi:hypothetical protein
VGPAITVSKRKELLKRPRVYLIVLSKTTEKKSHLSRCVEKLIDDIDSGKEPMKKAKSVDDFLKKVDKIVSEE